MLVFALAATALGVACSDHVRIGQDLPLSAGGELNLGGANNAGGISSVGGTAGLTANGGANTGGANTCHTATCQGKIYRCGDCLDNDGDGLIDSDDPECTGPCDDTEDSYYGGIPGGNNAPCHEDCYFDQDTGSGNDHCYWSQDCDPLSLAPNYAPSGDQRCAYNPATKIAGTAASCAQLEQAQEPTCLSFCGPLTPNGCDGFGCCELPAGSGKFVWLGSSNNNIGTCNETNLNDPTACRPCTPVTSTLNDCDPCEVCVGRTAPAGSCGANGSRCRTGTQACGQPGEAACNVDQYCITGCCEAAPK